MSPNTEAVTKVSISKIAGLLSGFYFGYFKITETESKTIFTKIEMPEINWRLKV
ncbi:MAG: hypothetical protein Q8N03_15975 [Ignavibacteria bacterium]|nr:hypothetical protein [Ignavibacteria bacterium]